MKQHLAYVIFQSTHLLRGATVQAIRNGRTQLFQSTHLLRGATADIKTTTATIRISIHAPLARCDSLSGLPPLIAHLFQSTHLLRGATFYRQYVWQRRTISIHAPLARCDCFLLLFLPATYYFNPRTSFEVRPAVPLSSWLLHHFNPRTSCEVRPKMATALRTAIYFNPRTSCEVRQNA